MLFPLFFNVGLPVRQHILWCCAFYLLLCLAKSKYSRSCYINNASCWKSFEVASIISFEICFRSSEDQGLSLGSAPLYWVHNVFCWIIIFLSITFGTYLNDWYIMINVKKTWYTIMFYKKVSNFLTRIVFGWTSLSLLFIWILIS